MKDKYSTYSIEDLITDDLFVNWVLEGENDTVWRDWGSKNSTNEQKISDARRIIELMKFNEEIITKGQKNQLWSRIDKATSARIVSVQRPYYKYAAGLAVAASLALLLFVLWPSKSVTIQTSDSIEYAQLPSSSTVEVMSNSTLTYSSSNWSKERSVFLQGEAIFEVTKGVSFIVNTDNGSVRVLGTKFKVTSRKKSFSVEVESGRVEVKSEGQKPEVLTAGMQVLKNPTLENIPTIDRSQNKIRYYQFENSTFTEVMKTLEEEFKIKLTIDPNVKRMQLTGSFDSSDSLEIALEKVMYPLNIRYKIEDDIIRLTPR